MKRSTFWRIGAISLASVIVGIGILFLQKQEGAPEDASSTEGSSATGTQDATPDAVSGGEENPAVTFSAAKLGTTDTDLPYCTVDGTKLLMDLHWATEGEGPFPIAVYVHGGGWSAGDKSENVGQYLRELQPKGVAVAAVNYRLSKEGHFPVMIEDIKCAIRHLRANAAVYDIDPNHIGAFGGSAGGHLVSLLGTADESAGWDVGPYQGVSSRVQAVVDMFGPTDLRIEFNGNSARSIQNIFGTKDFADMGFASPVTYVTPDDPPFFILHGDDDPLVPLSQSELFVDALEKAGVEVKFLLVKNSGHSFRPTVQGTKTDPTIQEIAKQVSDWLVDHLK